MATTERGRVLVVEGSASERGRQHGEALRSEVRAALCRFLDDSAIRTGLPGAAYVERFLAETAFVGAIRAHTPALLDELHGIADGAGVPLDHVLAYNFLDEEWWYSETLRSKCSTLAAPAAGGRPGLSHRRLQRRRRDLRERPRDAPPRRARPARGVRPARRARAAHRPGR